MTRRGSIGPWVGAMLAVLGCNPAPGNLTDGVDHVLLVSIDSLRADHLGVYGYARDTSPTLDALGESGLVFDRAYSTTSWTLPSHLALLTGLDDAAHGVTHHRKRLSPDIETLAEALGARGVRTVGFYSGPYLHPSFGAGRGFARWIDCTTAIGADAEQVTARQHFASYRGATNPRLLAAVKSWLGSDEIGAQNFLFLHMWDVHYDYDPPRRYVEQFDPDYAGSFTGRGFYRNPEVHEAMDPRDKEHLLALYDGEIRYTDDTLGEILALLETAGLRERTAIIVVADHGEEFFEHGATGHQRTLYEEVLRIPMIVNVPGQRPAQRHVDRVVSLVDVYPTICGLLGVRCSDDRTGDDLTRFFADPDATSRGDALALLSLPLANRSLEARVDGDGKLVRTRQGEHTQLEYFDREAQRRELDVEGSGPVARAAAEALAERLASVRAHGSDRRPVETERPTADPELESQLRALGYLEAESP